ncbi:MAG: FIVAR domain-containing protein, partial [Muribaculaceae bacterium]|nr:FIVAR domain-containing protein [Muribaculaceae bacterium]
AKAEAAEIGTAVGQYYASAIEAFKAAIADFVTRGAAVSEQDECDALTAEVLEATENFVGNTEVQPVKDVLSDLVEKVCEPLYEAEKDNVGDDQGQRPQEVVDAFKAAIEKAKGLCASATATEADLQDMIEARESFLTGAVSVSRAALRTALAKAEGEEYENLVAGEFDGNYPQEAIDAFNSALAAAKDADTDMSMTQEEVDAAAKALNDAMNNLAKSVVSIKFAALDAAIELALTTIAGATVVGDGEGECPKSVVDAYQAVIDEAAGIDRAAINQADVDALVAKLGEAKDTFCTALVASTGINAVIAEAQETLDNAEQGFKPGNYPASAIEALREVMNSAITVAENAASTQAELLDAAAKLREAIKTFAGEVVPAHDLTDLIALIAETEEFIATTGSDDFALSIALEAAKAIVENPDAYTKSEVTKAQNDLRKALDYAISSGIDGVTAEGAAIVIAEGKVIVAGIAGEFT